MTRRSGLVKGWAVFSVAFCSVAVMLALAGCGDGGPKRYHYAGKITYKGQPVPAGIIWFDPDLAAGTDGPQGFAEIKEGRFDTSQPGGLGAVGGKIILRVYGHDGIPAPELAMGKPIFSGVMISQDLPLADTQNLDIDVSAAEKSQPRVAVP
jgi:hypothetical protein